MKRLIILIFIINSSLLLPNIRNLNLMPFPKNIKLNKGKLIIKNDFNFKIMPYKNRRIEFSIKDFMNFLSKRTGIDFYFKDKKTDFIISYKKEIKLNFKMDESYNLDIRNNSIILKANTDIGIIRGIQTLKQLLTNDNNNFYFPNISIKDEPRFYWRGILIDTSRHFIPIEVLKRNLNAMAFVKMNVLHIHLTDDQGFRIESKTYPLLHKKSSDGYYYTQNEIKDLIKYANLLGIRIVPEFDIPAHTASWIFAYPYLGSSEKTLKMIRTYGVQNPVMDPSKKQVYKFLKKFFKEMTKLFPDEYIHIGGDEVNGVEWKNSERIKKFMQKKNLENLEDLQQYFNKKIYKILKKYGKKIVGWDEIYRKGLNKEFVIQSWRGKNFLFNAAKNRYYTILSNGYYIDLFQPSQYHYNNEPLPEFIKLKENEKAYVLGGEATMWAELVSKENIDLRIWPRSIAIAERFWSPKYIKDVDFMYKRMKRVKLLIEECGITHIKNRDMMLRRLIGDTKIDNLKILTKVVSPLKFYNRHKSKIYSFYSPLSRFVDCVEIDSEVSREFNQIVDKFLILNDKESERKIRYYLNLWKNNHKDIKVIIKSNPLLKEIEPLSFYLSKLSELAIKSLDNKLDFKTNHIEKLIADSKNPYAELRLRVIDSLEKLIYKKMKKEICIIKTNYGDMTFSFYEKDAPLTVLNFKKLIRNGFYNGKRFYRIVKGHVIQAGDGGSNNYPKVKAEFNKNKHIVGSLGLARGSEPDSGSTEFYICVAPRPHLDGKYTVFGQLIKGYDVLKRIENVEVIKHFIGKDKKIAFHEPKKPVIIKEINLILK